MEPLIIDRALLTPPLLAKLRSLQDAASGRAKVYLFGSALRACRINDVDVAIVTDDLQVLRSIQAEVSSDHDLQIVDLTALSSDEEKELDFLRTVGALEVTNVDWAGSQNKLHDYPASARSDIDPRRGDAKPKEMV